MKRVATIVLVLHSMEIRIIIKFVPLLNVYYHTLEVHIAAILILMVGKYKAGITFSDMIFNCS
jgi:uncharacterized membrane protein YiaA